MVNKSPSFVHELQLVLTPKEIKILDKRLDIARQIYNACLVEVLRHLKHMRESTLYAQALKNPKQTQARTELFNQAAKEYQFREYDFHRYVKMLCKGTWLAQHIDASTAQAIATRAFKTALKYALGKSGRPRFKNKNNFSSIQGKSNNTGIRWRDGRVEHCFTW